MRIFRRACLTINGTSTRRRTRGGRSTSGWWHRTMGIRRWGPSSNNRTLVTKTTVEFFLVFSRKVLNTDPLPTDEAPVCRRHSLHCLSGIFEKDVSKAGRTRRHPYVTNLAIATVRPKKLVFAAIVTKVTYYYSGDRH